MTLEGKIAQVAGSGRGIGGAIAMKCLLLLKLSLATL